MKISYDETSGGERVSHLYPNSGFYAHLSIYRFFSDFCRDGTILDAGCGTGYGVNHLIENGARFVVGIDNSGKAIRFCQYHFASDRLLFRKCDLNHIEKVKFLNDYRFDAIVSSNTLEHVKNVASLLLSANKLLSHNGVFLAAIPPITNVELIQENVKNPYHLHIWSPLQWSRFFSVFFHDISYYRHIMSKEAKQLDISDKPHVETCSDHDFSFRHCTLEELQSEQTTITMIVVAKKPKHRDDARMNPAHAIPASMDFSFSRKSSVIRRFRHLFDLKRTQFRKLKAAKDECGL